MERAELAQTLDRIEAAMEADTSTQLAGSGFWPAVAATKKDPHLADEFGARIAAIDQKAFKRWALLTVPIAAGTLLAEIIGMGGVILSVLAFSVDAPWNGILVLAGMGIVLVTTHGLAHLVVGVLSGIRFTYWFVGSLKRPQPGVKIDYSTYLKTPPARRAWMHASGAITSKIVPFVFIPIASVAGAPGWTHIILIVVGVGTILTDILWATRVSDWKKFRREMDLHKISKRAAT